MNKLGLGAKLGAKAKKDALRGMSADGELAADPGGGLFGGLGGLLGGGGRGGAPEMPDLSSMMGGGPRPMGSSATRKSAAKRKEKERQKRKNKNKKKRR